MDSVINHQAQRKTIAVVLCGGSGTRLRSVNADLPKPMVAVAERPFLQYILDYLLKQGVTKAILAVSYKKEAIMEHFGHAYKNLALCYSIEPSPLGTGGAIKQAIEQHTSNKDRIVVINGDTFTEYDLSAMHAALDKKKGKLVMSVKHIDDTDRYGRVSLTNENITAFEEKKSGLAGFINTGVYIFDRHLLKDFPDRDAFSFEKAYLEKKVHESGFLYSVFDGYFIDIGIPKDYFKAQMDLATHRG